MTASGTVVGAAFPSVRASQFREHWLWLAAIALLLVLPHVPGFSSNFGRSLLSQMGIATVFALSYSLLLGQTGLLSFGHAVYFGLGGFAAIHLMRAINARPAGFSSGSSSACSPRAAPVSFSR